MSIKKKIAEDIKRFFFLVTVLIFVHNNSNNVKSNKKVVRGWGDGLEHHFNNIFPFMLYAISEDDLL
ncbi:hypothetical protein ACJX0J_039316, partial [Zea mays]